MMKNKLAIVIPYYKIDFFEKTLFSISCQSDKRFKLYIGNDASPHNPHNLIEKHLKNVDYVYYDYENNVGGENLVNNWERILDNVQEEWFQILGDDDTISPNFVEEFYTHLSRVEKLDITTVRYTYFKIDERDNVICKFNSDWETISAQQFLLDKLTWKVGSSLSENIFKTDIWRYHKFKNFPLAWHSDDFALLEFSKFGNLYNIKQAHVNVRLSEKSITGNDSLQNEKQIASKLFYEELIVNRERINHQGFFKLVLSNYLFICRKLMVWPNKSAIYYIIKSVDLRLGMTLIKNLMHLLFRK